MEFRKIKTCIVGCGMISNIYTKNLVNSFSVIDVVACADIIPQAAEKRAKEYGVPKVLTMEEVYNSGDEIELCINLTGPAQHYEVIKKLLECGKHVWTEKVISLTVDQGKELVELADRKNLYLGVAPDTFLGAGLQTARQILDAGLIGKPTSVMAAINRNQNINSEVFRYMRSSDGSGSFPYDVGVYYVTAMLSLLGPVERVAGFAAKAPKYESRFLYTGSYGESWQLEGSNIVTGALQFKNGVMGTLLFDGTSIDFEEPVLRIYGTEGILHLGDPDRYNGEVILERFSGERTSIPLGHAFNGSDMLGDPTPFDWGGNRGVGAAELAWSIIKERKPRASKEFGLHTLEVLAGLDQAAKTGTTYEMTTTFERPRALPAGYPSKELGGFLKADAEFGLTL